MTFRSRRNRSAPSTAECTICALASSALAARIRRMRSLLLLTVASLLVSCRSHAEQDAVQQVDTVMVFSAPPQAAHTDSSTRAASMEKVTAALNAYAEHRIGADSAAKIIVAYQKKTGRQLNIVMDSDLMAAVRYEQQRRK